MLETNAFNGDNPTAQHLMEEKVFSRIAAQDESLFGFDPAAREHARSFFGWTHLATRPPIDLQVISDFAREMRAEGLSCVVLMGQGGSTQAAMTITKIHSLNRRDVAFKTLDSMSPVWTHRILDAYDPATTLYIVASKSGGTLEPNLTANIAWEHVVAALGSDEAAAKRFVAITDPGSPLEARAQREGWRRIFPGCTNVGGRFSALTVFGLLPAALVGIDIHQMLLDASIYEVACSQDMPSNPALRLASFLYENQQAGRWIFSLISPQPGRVFGLWVEQLVAESLGKKHRGILPNIEIDASMMALPRPDRCAITYAIRPDASFESDISRIDPSIPTIHCAIPDTVSTAAHFIMWEYAITAVAYLMQVDPFDQPNVQLTKDKVRDLLYSPDAVIGSTPGCLLLPAGRYVLETEVSPALCDPKYGPQPQTIDDALQRLFQSLRPGEFFSVNAFLPFIEEPRRVPMEEIRHCAAVHLGAASCLEIGPRYLHSTGQLHKGGPDKGVFLIISSEEPDDMPIPGESFSLGTFEHAQACGDMAALSEKGRRAVRLHLAGNDGETLSKVAAGICHAICLAAMSR
ncbi:MAG: hypothetical protein IJH83_02560 [Coriobacteriales bacterium]|nr:hypothetical protein [Coriobacteriales bacterium]